MDGPLSECRHKIERAKEHCRALYSEIKRFLDSQPYSLIPEYDAETATYLFKLKIAEPIPQARWALIVGDCVHNARSSLDYIAWRLAGSKLPDRQTFFPIYATEIGFIQNVIKHRQLDTRIHQDAFIEIRNCQPYLRGHPQEDHLWFLQELDARDKHKLLTMTGTMTHGGRSGVIWAPVGDVCSDTIWNLDTRLDDGAKIAEVRFPIGTRQSEVNVEIQPIYDIAFERGIFGRPSRAYPVDTYLSKIIKTVDNIIIRFENLLIRNPDWLP
jgi:hypothetical protein